MTDKCVLISIRPQWCELITNGKKTIEVRKSRPKLDTPFKCYIYETLGKKHVHYSQPGYAYDKYGMIVSSDVVEKYEHYDGSGQVIGEFVCDGIVPINIYYSNPESRIALKEFPRTGLTDKEIINYLGNGKGGYAWHISAPQIYDKPMELSEFHKPDDLSDFAYPDRLTRPPQSWCYIEEAEESYGQT